MSIPPQKRLIDNVMKDKEYLERKIKNLENDMENIEESILFLRNRLNADIEFLKTVNNKFLKTTGE